MIQACQCQANPTPSRGWKPFCSLPRVRFCAVTTSPLIQYDEPPGRNGCAEMTVHRQVAVRAKLVRTASTRFPRYGTAKSWQNASKCPQKPAGRRCAAWRPPCGRGPAMPRSADTSNLIVAFGSATVFTSTSGAGRPAQNGLAQDACRGTAVDVCASYVAGQNEAPFDCQ